MNRRKCHGCNMRRFFIWSVIAILFLTSIAKLVSATGSARVLELPDPLLGISNRHLLWAGGLLETLLMMVLLISSRPVLQLALIAWLGSIFAVYRVGILAMAPPKYHCPCLGTVTQKLGLSPAVADQIMLVLLLYLLLGSLVFLLGERLKLQREKQHRTQEPGVRQATVGVTE
jgi:hypothetical protein